MELVGTAPGRVPARAGAAGVRLTRRGRLVALLLLLVLAGLALAFASPASDAATPPGPPAVVVVHPGDSLWSIAARYRPSNDAPRVVAEIRRLNGLPDDTIHAGDRLILPGRG
ncbi:MAG TPA: LysM peptidoglycan-binding domain-containing protein [Rugosimonospora sp.]|nr:LysM peptidoglycan-binding domain-containing protein [Rugosimonospora sp.]